MKYAANIVLIFVCFFAGFSARDSNIRARAIHADEAEQATTAMLLRDSGKYEYNPNGPHGPTLYYWANAVKMPDSQTASIADFRRSLAPVGVLVLAALIMSGMYVGRGAAWAAAACFSMTAMGQIYSGYFVHEIIFALAVFAAALAVWRFACAPAAATALIAGLFVGLSQATKETAVISYAAMGISFCVCAALEKNIRDNLKYALFSANAFKFGAAFLCGFALVAVLFYSSFGSNWRGVLDAVKSYAHFFDKSQSQAFASDFFYYFKLLTLQKSEGVWFGELPLSLLAVGGFAYALWRRTKYPWKCTFAIFAFLNAFSAVLILSFIKYKTPWLLLSPVVFLCVPAGFAVASLLKDKKTLLLISAYAAIAALGFWQYRLSGSAVAKYHSDPRNPFIYSHTVRDFSNLVSRIETAAKYSEYENDIPVAFIMKESPWPAPFNLRRFRNAGFWSGGQMPNDISIFDVVVCDYATEKNVEKLLDASKYEREFYGLRKNLVLTLFIKKEIFDKIVNRQ